MNRPPGGWAGPTREERVEWDDLSLDILLPLSSDDLIDVSDFNTDERLPYWAELWPSARALAVYVREHRREASHGIELGCGVGLPSLALQSLGWKILATDYYPEALEFVKLNAVRNGIEPPAAHLVDWRQPPDLGRYPLVLAADVLYEQRNIEGLGRVLNAVTADGGEVLLADPGRTWLEVFLERITDSGWSATLVDRREMAPVTDTARPSTIQIWRLLRPLQATQRASI